MALQQDVRVRVSERSQETLFQTAVDRTRNQAEVFARALQHYWAGRFDEAIHIALPRIEVVLRQDSLSMAGGVVWNPPQSGTSPMPERAGGVKSPRRQSFKALSPVDA